MLVTHVSTHSKQIPTTICTIIHRIVTTMYKMVSRLVSGRMSLQLIVRFSITMLQIRVMTCFRILWSTLVVMLLCGSMPKRTILIIRISIMLLLMNIVIDMLAIILSSMVTIVMMSKVLTTSTVLLFLRLFALRMLLSRQSTN